ncbi:MAG: hypothetical protein PHY41_03865 [Candidatus Cloacimonetes bacterium]|jgi:hypothetical protein|nr:hypothetical protein [Candidatus Cloacimonadota bacterium]MDY0299796.1 hypothetical protein [Candidatus Cloacimonadaceae bacterium]MCB5279744.1 hypothetical protein [Candidatus Cloacimonadota bacterium]MCK9333497.1 hypothetical protein [Candidatus Cloacimonadota bacterium]MDD2211299.1 hypothetical protein [Candidatus Cloacimonadota bacterium]
MSETAKNTQVKVNSNQKVSDTHKVSLVELIMILLLVGLLFVFFFGMRQLRIDKAAEALAHEKFEALIPVLQEAINATEEFRRNDEFGDYPFDFGQLNLMGSNAYEVKTDDTGMMYMETEDFVIHYDADNFNYTATTTENFGKAGIKVIYVLSESSYQVEDPAPERKPTILDEWLPQE